MNNAVEIDVFHFAANFLNSSLTVRIMTSQDDPKEGTSGTFSGRYFRM